MSRSARHVCACAALAALTAAWSFSQEPPPRESAKSADSKKPPAKARPDASAAESALLKKLQVPTEFAFEATPLKDALAALATKHGVPIVLHHKGLSESGVADDVPVTRTVRGVSLETALNRLLRDHQLVWVLRHEVIDVTSRDDASTFMVTRVYVVGDLVPKRLDFESLTELITNTISPDSWQNAGGPGTIEQDRTTVVITQSQVVHRTVAALLAALPRAGQMPSGRAPLETAIPCYDGRGERRILEMLEKRVSVSFKDASLPEVARTLAKEHGLPIDFDRRALADDHVEWEKAQVSLTVSGITLRSVLDLLLREAELSWIVEDDELLVTTRDAAQTRLRTKVYPVTDLLDLTDPSGDSLIEVITNSVLSDQWQEAGGPGTLEFDDSSRSLVCMQHREAHEAVERLLIDLRQKEPKATPDEPPPEDDEVTVCQYTIDRQGAPRAKIIEATSTLVRELIAADTWRAKETPFYLRPSADGLAVRHTAKVQREIQQMLASLDVLAPPGDASPAAPPDE